MGLFTSVWNKKDKEEKPLAYPTYNRQKDINEQDRIRRAARYNVSGPFGNVSWQGNTLNVSQSPLGSESSNLMRSMLGNFQANSNQQVQDTQPFQRIFASLQNQNAQEFQKQQRGLGNRLYNQGITAGSNAYNKAMRSLEQGNRQANDQSYATAFGLAQQPLEANRNYGLNMWRALSPIAQYNPLQATGNPLDYNGLNNVYKEAFASDISKFNVDRDEMIRQEELRRLAAQEKAKAKGRLFKSILSGIGTLGGAMLGIPRVG